jgi:radical SAM superfamily enzyme YgiQ (UPF0313 family)
MITVLLMRPPTSIRYSTLPIGLLYIASYLEKYGKKVYIYDGRIESESIEKLKDIINYIKPDYIGISLLTYEGNFGHLTASIAKQINNKIKIVIGGPHASTFPRCILKDKNIDIVCCSEGEIAMNEICSGKKFEEIPNIYYRNEDANIVCNPVGEFIDINDIPLPAYHLIDFNKYFSKTIVHGHLYADNRIASIVTSRGCPYGCIYCHKSFGRNTRLRTPESIIMEMKILYEKYNVREIHIEDDIFNIDINRAKKIMKLILENKLKIHIQFPNGIRADLIDEDLMAKFKLAGVYRMSLGIETANPEIQKYIDKNLKLSEVEKTINLARKYNISVNGFFMIGFPYESYEQITNTINLSKKLKLCSAEFSIVTPFPATMLYHIVKNEMKINLPTDINYYQTHNKIINLSAVSDSELQRFHKHAFITFYLNPLHFYRLFISSPNKIIFIKYLFKFIFFIIKPRPVGIDKDKEKYLNDLYIQKVGFNFYSTESENENFIKHYTNREKIENYWK